MATQTASKLTDKMNFKFVEGDEAEEILLDSDPYISQMTPFERGIRMDVDRDVSEEEFREYIVKQVRPWTDDEKELLKKVLMKVEKQFEDYIFQFPDPIKLIKTNGLEDIRECRGYCRRNTIVMGQNTIYNITESFFLHELFHIQSQNNPELRYKLYEDLGFHRCNEIVLPPSLANKKITNPDAPRLDVYITVSHSGKKVTGVPVIFYNKEGPDGFFNRLYIRLLAVKYSKEKSEWVYDLDENSDPILISVDDTEDFFAQIGKSHYYFHPEEILATRFEQMVGIKSAGLDPVDPFYVKLLDAIVK